MDGRLDRAHWALIAVNRAIAAHTQRDELFAEIASHVRSVLDFDKMALIVPSPDGDGAAVYAIVGGGARRPRSRSNWLSSRRSERQRPSQ